jgi:hypothetical protein
VVDPTSKAEPTDDAPPAEADRRRRDRPPGHGRHGAAAYAGARRIDVPHPQLHHGDRCPHCANGKLYVQRKPGLLIRLVGHAPIAATVYALETLRCNLCGDLVTADPPPGVGTEQYDATAGAMIAVLKYGTGLAFHRLDRLQANLQIPLPASTQWEIVSDVAVWLQPVLHALTEQAAQGEILHNDDTSMTVLELRGRAGSRGDPPADDVPPDRTGVLTSAVVSTRAGRRIALFLTGRRHARISPRCWRRARRGSRPPDSDVRCAEPQPAEAVDGDPGALPRACATSCRQRHAEFPGRVPAYPRAVA